MHNSNAMTDGQLILDEPAYICFLFKAPKPRRMAPEGTFCHRLFSFSLFSPPIYPLPSPSIQLLHPLFVPFSAPPSPPPSLSLSLSLSLLLLSLSLSRSLSVWPTRIVTKTASSSHSARYAQKGRQIQSGNRSSLVSL